MNKWGAKLPIFLLETIMTLYELITNTDVDIQRIVTWLLSAQYKNENEIDFSSTKDHAEFVAEWFETNAPEFKVIINYIDPECKVHIIWNAKSSA